MRAAVASVGPYLVVSTDREGDERQHYVTKAGKFVGHFEGVPHPRTGELDPWSCPLRLVTEMDVPLGDDDLAKLYGVAYRLRRFLGETGAFLDGLMN